MERRAALRADVALLLVAVAWGLTFPLIRSALEDVAPLPFLAARFGTAALLFAPLVLVIPRVRRALRPALVPGLLLGIIAFVSYLAQTVGLETVPAGRAAFITGTNVVIVPLIGPAFRAGRPRLADLLAAGVALAGLWLMTDPAGGGVTTGDLYVASCAFAYAVYIHGLQVALRGRPDALALAFLQVAALAGVSVLALPLAGDLRIEASRPVVVAVLFCALVATVGTFWLQTRFQGDTTPQRAALMFATEPVFAAAFAAALLGERLDAAQAVGAGLILGAVLLVQRWPAARVREARDT